MTSLVELWVLDHRRRHRPGRARRRIERPHHAPAFCVLPYTGAISPIGRFGGELHRRRYGSAGGVSGTWLAIGQAALDGLLIPRSESRPGLWVQLK